MNPRAGPCDNSGGSREERERDSSTVTPWPRDDPEEMFALVAVLCAVATGGCMKVQEEEEEEEETIKEIIKDAEYYQIDSDHSIISLDSKFQHESDSSSSSSSSSNDTTGGMLLAITPITITDLDQGIQELSKVTENKIDKWCRSLFQSWEGIGNSFLSEQSPQQDLGPSTTKYALIDLDQLKDFMVLIQRRHKEMKMMESSVSDSLETLLDRMCMNVDSLTEIHVLEEAETDHVRIMIEWCRSILAVIQWMLCCKEERHKQEEEEQLLDFNLLYPTEEDDSKSMTTSMMTSLHNKRIINPTNPTLSPNVFYNTAICKKLNIKNEYRIWKRVLLYGEGRQSTWISRQGETENQRRF